MTGESGKNLVCIGKVAQTHAASPLQEGTIGKELADAVDGIYTGQSSTPTKERQKNRPKDEPGSASKAMGTHVS